MGADDLGHVLVLNQYVLPDTAVTGRVAHEVAVAIAAGGQRVTFVAGQPSYLPGQPAAPARERRDGVEIRRLGIAGRWGRGNRAARFAGYLIYLIRAAIVAGRLIATDPPQTIVCFHNPPLLPLLGALLAGPRRRFVAVVQDVHPDVLLATGWITLPGPVIAAWRGVNRWTYHRATTIIVISEDMRAALIEQGAQASKVVAIPLWAQPELTPRTDRIDRGARTDRIDPGARDLVVLFAGNMGLTQRLEPVFAAAAELVGAPIRFIFAGGGIHADRWQAASAHLANVTFLPFQADADYRELVAAADVGLVTLTPRLERLVVPSRAFPLLSAGIPLLAVMSSDCELGRLVADYGCGACVQRPDELVAALTGWLENPPALARAARGARAAYTATRDRATMTQRYAAVIAAAAASTA
jgi:glycosyltransferase involved in cell wall biosynthesis